MKKKEKELSDDERKKLWQSICGHNGGLLTNTGTSGSKCALCGKEMTPPNPNINV